MEKKNKRKFWGTLTSFLLTFMFISSWAVLGVALALKTANVNVAGTVQFTTVDVQATIEKVSVTGAQDNTMTGKFNKLTYSKAQAPTTEELNSWKGLALNFVDEGTPEEVAKDIVITFKVTNNNQAGKAMNVTFKDITEPADGANYTLTVDAEGTSVANNGVKEVAAGSSITVTITFHVVNADKDVAIANWNVGLTLENKTNA